MLYFLFLYFYWQSANRNMEFPTFCAHTWVVNFFCWMLVGCSMGNSITLRGMGKGGEGEFSTSNLRSLRLICRRIETKLE